MNKASGGDGIPVELFQILKDDAVKVLHLPGQQIWKTQQWPQDWKRSVFILIAKKGSIKDRTGMDLTEPKILRRGGKNTQKNCTKKIFTTQIIMMV